MRVRRHFQKKSSRQTHIFFLQIYTCFNVFLQWLIVFFPQIFLIKSYRISHCVNAFTRLLASYMIWTRWNFYTILHMIVMNTHHSSMRSLSTRCSQDIKINFFSTILRHKERDKKPLKLICDGQTDGWTNGPTEKWLTESHRTRLKRLESTVEWKHETESVLASLENQTTFILRLRWQKIPIRPFPKPSFKEPKYLIMLF